ncbi:MAG: hypothetical protein QOH78_1024, partial [Verrucomicrobiota bacterium]
MLKPLATKWELASLVHPLAVELFLEDTSALSFICPMVLFS